jgi:phage anti-repressor protein
MKELVKISKQAIGDEEVNAVDARELHGTLESKQEYANWIKARINQLGLIKGVDFVVIDKVIKRENSSGASKRIDYILTLDAAKHIAMAERNEMGKKVRMYFIEFEKNAKKAMQEILDDPDKFLDLAIKLREERNKAIREKALIGSTREATAMATASVAVRKQKKLEVMIDESREWATIKRVEISTGNKYNWREMKRVSQELGIRPKKVFDANYGEVNSYHGSVWLEVYRIDIAEL